MSDSSSNTPGFYLWFLQTSRLYKERQNWTHFSAGKVKEEQANEMHF